MSTTATKGPDALVLADVNAGYGETVVLNNLSLTIPGGATLAVLGRNGVGKTTLLTTIIGRTRLHSGSITFGEREIGRLPIYRRAEQGIALVPQEREIFRSLTVEENLTVGQRPGAWTVPRVYEYFPSLAKRRRNHGDQLSGGEQQMLSLGRALMGNPTVLLLDEPLEGLAPVIVEALLAGLERLKKEAGLTMVLVEQHAKLALQFCQDVIVLERGAITYSGKSADLARSPELMGKLLGMKGMAAAG